MTHESTDTTAAPDYPTSPGAPDRDRRTPLGEDPVTEGRKFVVFILGDEHFAVESHAVTEVVRDLRLTPIPNLPEWMLGIANLRGEIVSVIDLQHLMGIPALTTNPTRRHIVFSDDSPDSLIAFPVDRLKEVATVPPSAVRSVASDKVPFQTATIEYKAVELRVLDPALIMSALKLD